MLMQTHSADVFAYIKYGYDVTEICLTGCQWQWTYIVETSTFIVSDGYHILYGSYAPLSWRIRRYPCPWFWISCLCGSPRPGTPRRTACRRGSGREPWKIHPPLSWGWEMCLVHSFVDWISSLEFNSGNSIFTVGHLQKKVFLVPSVCFHFLFSPLHLRW